MNRYRQTEIDRDPQKLPSTTSYHRACTTKLAQTTSQHYFVLQSLHKVLQNRNFTSVFDDRTSFRAKGLRRTVQNRNLTIEPHFVRNKGCDRRRKLAILLQFLTIEPHFVRKGCIRGASLALPRALREK